VVKAGWRAGDNAAMAVIQVVEALEIDAAREVPAEDEASVESTEEVVEPAPDDTAAPSTDEPEPTEE
jgi:hypothetical protein